MNSKPSLKVQLIVFSLFFIIAFIIYSNTFHVPFYFDDETNIVRNPYIHMRELSIDSIKKALTMGYAKNRPFANLSFAINYYFGKLNVFGYHLVNIIIHALAGIGVYLLIFTTLGLTKYREKRFEIALFTGLLWLAHPIQTQAVTYIVQRMTSMCSMFYIFSLLFYSLGRQRKGKAAWLYFSFSAITGILAFGTKEIAATLPFFIFLYEIAFFPGSLKKKSLLFFAMLVPMIIVGILYMGGLHNLLGQLKRILSNEYGNRPFTVSERLMTEARVVLYYLSLIVYPRPSRLNLDYDFPLSKGLFAPPTTFFSIIIIFIFVALGLFLLRKKPLIGFFILWYFGNLVIESSVFGFELVYEHRLYLPSIAPILLFTLLCFSFLDLLKKRKAKAFA
ncbi:MAG: hypothetical protein DRG20_05375 [Deltaproteobacteria bacterium]|nr:MAG: hypothetical protein DRG20_05375 [Deltaproteobacteria bacterium]